MRILLIIITITILCISCGRKADPEYKSQNHKYKTIYII